MGYLYNRELESHESDCRGKTEMNHSSFFLRLLGLLFIVFLAFFGAGIRAAFSQETVRPNVVLILIDDMGWGDFSCFGNTEAQTPNIDAIASRGIRFEQFYVNAPICSPSRCALVTGNYPQRWNIHSYLSNRLENQRRGCVDWLDPKAPTLARALQVHGYATGHFGKWHLGGQRDVDNAPSIAEYGFDASLTNFEGMGPKLLPLTQKPGDSQPGRIWQDAERLGDPVTWMQRSQVTGGFVKSAVEFAKQARAGNKPFYINLWPDDVHSPFWPAVENWPTQEGKSKKRAMYSAVLEGMDRQLGELFGYLQSDPSIRDNTLLVICSDNGPEAQAGSSGPFRNGKTSLYEGGIRSPLIVWGPGLMDPQSHGTLDTESVFASMDLVPSILEICKVDTNGMRLDGQSVAKAVLGKEHQSRDAAICWRRPPDRKTYSQESIELLPDLAIREGRWKLLCDYDGSNPQLYDLLADRGETINLARGASISAEHADTIERLTQQVLAWHRSVPADKGAELGQAAIRRVVESKKPQGESTSDQVFTFYATSDSHYEAIEKLERNERNRITIERMNALPGESWPEKLGGGPIGKPRGVLALGDLIDDGDKNGQTDIEWMKFQEQFGLDGKDGLLRFPVFEGWGNHDGPPEDFIKQRVSVQREIRLRNQARMDKRLVSRLSENGLHYSWDWEGIHFIQTNLYPADKQNAKVKYSLPWHDPQGALAFVKEDLAKAVGESGRPVIIMSHCGFDTDWWVLEDWVAFYEVVEPYNLLAYFHGHSGTGVKTWKPEGASKAIDVINTGQTEKGFFVVEIGQGRMRLGYHVKKDPAQLQNIDWDWRYLFEKRY